MELRLLTFALTALTFNGHWLHVVRERGQIHRSMLQQPDVMNHVADDDAATAYGLLCKQHSVGRMTLLRFTTTCSGGRVHPTSNASADQSPIAGLFADAAGRGAGRMADAGRRAAAQTAALRSLLSTAPWPC